VLIKNSSALEALSTVQTAVLDKTGTLTLGRPLLRSIEAIAPFRENEVLQLAASVEQGSSHSVAAAIVNAAHTRGLSLYNPDEVAEAPGQGIEGVVATHKVVVGSHAFAATKSIDPAALMNGENDTAVVVVDGKVSALIKIGDEPRLEAREAVSRLRALGVRRIALATGDDLPAARAVATSIGVDRVFASLSPAEKVDLIHAELRHGPVMMVGDGTNDAPALATASVGVAMGVQGTAASAQTAHAVLLSDNLCKIPEVIVIARYSRHIAVQSIVVGLSLSGIAMIMAAAGFLPPVQGALVQEAIDVAVIANAMRALRDV
jgi:P-type E1-E2 ATPase